MCGVWMRTRYNEKVDLKELFHPVRFLSHRGPDHYGWWKDEHVALVHTRLSIIDLSGGAQPLQSSDRKWVGIVNGEIYDYKKLRKSLIDRGVEFKTESDSEVLLNLYALEGPLGLQNLSGEFSFIFYNKTAQQVHFGRDPFGVKPLFFEARNESFTLASEMKALQDEKPVFDPEYLKAFIARAVSPPQTSLKNVQHVWPGRVYTLDLFSKKLSWQKYQQIPLFQKRTLKGKEAEEVLEYELKESVRRRLEADVEVGCYLSGGIDSAIIAAMADDLGARPQTFTVGFTDLDFDESKQAAKIAQDLGLRHNIVQLGKKNFMDSLIQSIVAFENPITNPHGAAKNLLSSFASQQVKVVLSGEGADEWLGGYAYFRIKKLKDFISRHPRLAKDTMNQLFLREMGMSLNHLDGQSELYNEISAKFFNGKSPVLLGRLAKKRLYQHIVGDHLDYKINEICESLSEKFCEETHVTDFSDWDLNSWISNRTDLLHYILANVGDRQEMAHSLEGRTPFLDSKVTQVIGKIHPDTLMRGLTEKYVLRKIGGKYLNLEHQQRGKKPFFSPMKYLYLKENQTIIKSYIDIARAETPWLQWKNIDHFLSFSKRSYKSPLEDSRISLVLILFSLGVLSSHLRDKPKKPRGYELPETTDDLFSYERTF